MKASKLAAIISSLSGDEKKQFEKYVISPFFNTNDTLIYLWDSLPAKFSVNHDEIDGVRIWKKLGMRTTYTDDALRKLLSKLNHLIEGFITYLQYDKAIDKHLYFLEACNARKLPKHFASGDRQTSEVIKENDYYNNFCVNYNRDKNQRQNGEQRTHTLAAMKNLDSFYIKKKLELYNLYFSTRYTQNMPYETVSFKRFGQYAEHEIANNLMFRFYYCLSSMFDNEKTDSLAQLWAILNDGEQQNISKNEQRYIYKGIRNQLTLKVNAKADIETNKELAFLYETLEKKDFLLHKNELSIFQYKQAIIANLRAGNERIEWAYQFMNRNKAFLNPVHQENVYQYCLAYYFFAKKEFETSLKQLEQINEENIVIDKDSLYYIGHYHFLILQNYYELDKLDELLSYILSYKDSLKSNDILPSKIIKKHLNFVSTLNNILKLRKGDQKKGKVYYEKVVETRDVYGRAWLLQKLNLKMIKSTPQLGKKRRSKYSTTPPKLNR